MITVKLTIPKPFLLKVRQSPEVARSIFANKVDHEVHPALQKVTQDRLGKPPGAVSRLFEFSTARSRRFYFAKFKGRLPYQRTGQIEKGWRVDFDRRLKDGQLIIRNVMPASGYVYGPGNPLASFRQVPGHQRTGWGRGFAAEFEFLRRYGVDLMRTAWRESVKESLE